tara:strand:- start:14915 stop:15121 length:207 start_codon:yes stop_codon:yes gene_type:complete
MKSQKFDIISPDGFSIHMSDTYKTPEKAWKAFEAWKGRYSAQGYYSSNAGRIPLDQLKDSCSLVTVNY